MNYRYLASVLTRASSYGAAVSCLTQRLLYRFLALLIALPAASASPASPSPASAGNAVTDAQLSTILTEGYDPTWRDSVIQSALADKVVRDAKIGLYIEDLRTGEVLADVNGDVPLTPASVTKSVTAATVLALHNPEERIATEIKIRGHIKGETLDGDVIVYASGDPTVESEFFPDYAGFADSIAAAISVLGIKKIKGEVEIDLSSMPDEGFPSGWQSNDISSNYGTGHQTATFADNTLTLRMPSKVTVPYTPGLKIVKAGKRGKMRASSSRGSSKVTVSGKIPRKGNAVKIPNPLPSSSMKGAVEVALKDYGIELEKPGKGGRKENSVEETLVYTHLSPPVREILKSLMYRSDNTMAEGMLRFLAPAKGRDEALRMEKEYWQSRTVDFTDIVIRDGSGLSREDRLTPYFLADINVMMAQDSLIAPYYVDLFPKAGLDGTMKRSFLETPLEGRIALKTGTLNGVRTLSGYLLDSKGRPTHTVVVMINGYTCPYGKLKNWIESLLLKILP